MCGGNVKIGEDNEYLCCLWYLGKGKGTPSLKQGIHCVRVDRDDETDDSDWQGF